MSASEKLRDWRDNLIEGTVLPVDVVDSLLAVVEAAEGLRPIFADTFTRTGMNKTPLHILDAALTALSEALGGGDDARVQGLQADLQIADDAVRAMQDWRDGLEAKNARLREALAEIAQDPLGSHGARALARAALADPVE